MIQSKRNGYNRKKEYNGWTLELSIDSGNDEYVIAIKNLEWPLLLAKIYKLKMEMEIKIENQAFLSAKTKRTYFYDGYDSWSSKFGTGLYAKTITNYTKTRFKFEINVKITNIYDENDYEIGIKDYIVCNRKNKCIQVLYGGVSSKKINV